MNRIEFVKGISLLTSAIGRQMPDEQIAAWYALLKNPTGEQLQRGIVETLRTHRFAGFPPVGTVLSNAGIGGTAKDGALRAWLAVREAIRKVGGYDSVTFDDPTVNAVLRGFGPWDKITETPVDELKWLKKEFVDQYQAFCGRTLPEELTRRLSGVFEASHAREGYGSEAVRVAHVRCLTHTGQDAPLITYRTEEPVKPPTAIVGQFVNSLAVSLDAADETHPDETSVRRQSSSSNSTTSGSA